MGDRHQQDKEQFGTEFMDELEISGILMRYPTRQTIQFHSVDVTLVGS